MIRVLTGDCREVLKTLESGSVHMCCTSPPYFGLRDYQVAGQIGLEQTPDVYVSELVAVFREIRRILRDDGTVWLNLGDSYVSNGRYDGAYEAKKNRSGIHQNDAQKYAQYDPRVAARASGLKPKDLIGIPWRVAFALQADGWYLRRDIIWHKPNPMPESVTDRCTSSHEYIFHLSKSAQYYYDADAIAENAIYAGLANQDESGFKDPRSFNGKHKEGYRSSDKQRGHVQGFSDRWDAMKKEDQCSGKRNKRSVWTVATKPFAEAHFATFPPALIQPCIMAGCPAGGMVLDPFGGAGTTGLVADGLRRNAILIELNPGYAKMAADRIQGSAPMFASVETTDSADSPEGT
jgi:DNA modification methylase